MKDGENKQSNKNKFIADMVKDQQKGLMTLDELDKIYKKMLDKRVKP